MKYFFPLLIYLNLSLYAQLKDDFSSPDLATWQGDTSQFVIENQSLKSNGANTTNQNIYLVKPSTILQKTEWYLSVDLKFNPTASNSVKFYLASDQADLSTALNGYFIQFGETNSDTLDFFVQTGTQITKIFTGKTSFKNNLKCDLKIFRDSLGNWSFYMDPETKQEYLFEGAIFNDQVINTKYFGIRCQYATATRYNQFYFDNFEVKLTVKDSIAPSLLKSQWIDDTSFVLYFSEKVKGLKLDIPNFGIKDIKYLSVDSSTVKVDLAEILPSGKSFTYTIKTVSDMTNNSSTGKVYEIICPRKPSKHEIQFSELMVDESPSQGLPEHEYIEIYTLSNDYLSTKNCYLEDAGKKYLFPDTILDPNSYYLLCVKSSAVDFGFVSNKLVFNTLPALSNSGKTLKILHESNTISSVTYSDKWYQDDTKSEGGWSLEVLDIDNFCEEYYNWKSSVSTLGGTPGILNSVQKEWIDSTKFDLLSIDFLVDSILQLKFNKRLNLNNIYENSLKIRHAQLSHINSDFFAEGIISIHLSRLDSNQIFDLVIENLQDCYGNPFQFDTTLSLPRKVDAFQILINEILFDAKENDAEYVEIYNTQNFSLNLKDLFLSKRKNDTLYTSKRITNKNLWLAGHELIVLTDQKESLMSNYDNILENRIITMNSWPQLADDSGTVILHRADGSIIDLFHYDKNFHNLLIQNPDGVSLEKISPSAPSNNPLIWKSAAQTAGFGTPTLENSQNISLKSAFSISPKIISPNGDGRDDYCMIKPLSSENVDFVNIKIVDIEGRVVKNLAQNSSIGGGSMFTWDGTLDNLSKAAFGQYLVHIEHYGFGKDRKVERYCIAVFE